VRNCIFFVYFHSLSSQSPTHSPKESISLSDVKAGLLDTLSREKTIKSGIDIFQSIIWTFMVSCMYNSLSLFTIRGHGEIGPV